MVVVAVSALLADGGANGRPARRGVRPTPRMVAARPRPRPRATFAPCDDLGFDALVCFDVVVPLDRSGRVPGNVTLFVAERPGRGGAGAGPVLLALSGGPGQPGALLAGFIPAFAESVGVDTSEVTVIGVDQRGTGASALDCPALQRQALADLTTPLADARAEAARWPAGRLVVVAGAGHGASLSRCGARTLWRFVEGRSLPPCPPEPLPRVHGRYAVARR